MNKEEYLKRFADEFCKRADWDRDDALKIADSWFDLGDKDDPEGDAEEELSNWYD